MFNFSVEGILHEKVHAYRTNRPKQLVQLVSKYHFVRYIADLAEPERFSDNRACKNLRLIKLTSRAGLSSPTYSLSALRTAMLAYV